jgi:ADP-ribose pyrophosphatase YjhB (NUDIX family)
MAEPRWLTWVREMQALAQTGLAFTKDPYDRERFEALRQLAARIAAEHADADLSAVTGLFGAEAGYATPKVDVRGAVFDATGRILLVREAVDGDRWTLPGGWADVNQSPAECVAREVREEAGLQVTVRKLAAVYDRMRHPHPPSEFHIYKLFFICEPVGGTLTTSLETTEAAFFAEDALPSDLSLGRTLPAQLARMFAHYRDPALPTEFD